MRGTLVRLLLLAGSTVALRAGVRSQEKPTPNSTQTIRRASHVAINSALSVSRHNSSVSARHPEAALPSLSRSVKVALCQPVRNPEWLTLLRKSWLNEVAADPQFAALVFIPSRVPGENNETTLATKWEKAGQGLDMMLLNDWHGDVGTFQGAFTGAIAPCMAYVSAGWYAMLDDDILVFPLVFQQTVSHLNPYEMVLYGRKGEVTAPKRIIYGGLMLMSRQTTEKVVNSMDSKFQAVIDETHKRGLTIYRGTHAGFNVDHFFSIMVELLGGTIREFEEIGDLRPEVPWNRGLPKHSIMAVHHMKEADFDDFLKHPLLRSMAKKGAADPIRKWMALRCLGKCI